MLTIEWILFLFGHLAIACVAFNHVHAFALPAPRGTRHRKVTEKLIFLLAVTPIPFLFYAIFFGAPGNLPFRFYFQCGKFVGAYFVMRWIYRAITTKLPKGVVLESSDYLKMQLQTNQELLVGYKANLLGAVPGNQITDLKIQNWTFRIRGLPDDLAGLKICQLSDLHFTGLIAKEYFARVVSLINDQQPDLILMTGDILDTNQCLDWVEDVLSKLQSKHGNYYVLGNHDLLISDQQSYRQRLANAGLIATDVGRCQHLDIGNARIRLAGNSLPWFSATSGLLDAPIEKSRPEFSILMSHSPDQIGWAVHRNFDLVFAGHTHGGQIRLPIVGAIIAPSRYGIKYASGTFRIRNTLMHVSRGLSGDEPIRINCPPELGFFTLKSI